jgi:hypothetical protein
LEDKNHRQYISKKEMEFAWDKFLNPLREIIQLKKTLQSSFSKLYKFTIIFYNFLLVS